MSDRKPRRKLKRREVSKRILAAVEDVRQNGRAGRTVEAIARQYGIHVGTLQHKLGEAGLTRSKTEPATTEKPGGISVETVAAIPEILPKSTSGNFLTTREEGQNGSNLSEVKGGGGEILQHEQVAEAFGREVRQRIEDAVRLSGLIEIKNAGDLEKLVRTYRETLRPLDGGSSLGSGTLIQVNVLGDSSAPAPRIVRPISNSASNSPD